MNKQEEQKDDLIEKIDTLAQALGAGEYNSIHDNLTYGGVLSVEERVNEANEFMTEETEKAMANSIKSLSTKDSVCIFLGVQVRNDNLRSGIQAIVSDLNLLMSEGLIVGSLANVSSLKLARIPRQDFSSVVFAYAHVKKDYVDRAKSLVQYEISEDAQTENTKKIGDLSLSLGDDEFIVVNSYSHQISMLLNSSGMEQRLLQDVNQLMAILPKGTEYLGATRCAIMGLSVDFELKFSNPLLKKVKEVRLDYVREAAPVGDGLIQGIVLTGITYLDKEGNKLYV